MDLRPDQPGCRLWGSCGGCDPVLTQQSNSSLFVNHSLELERLLAPFNAPPIELVASPEDYHQRRRVLLRMHCHPGQHSDVGFFAKGSRTLLVVDECLQLRQELKPLLASLRQFRSTHEAKLRIRADVYKHSGRPSLIIDIHIAEISDGLQNELATTLKTYLRSQLIDILFSDENDSPVFCEDDGLFFSAQGFRQSHAVMNQKLREVVAEHLRSLKPLSVIEMGCGNGNLTVAAQYHAAITYVDHDSGNIAALEANISRFGTLT